MNTIAEGKLTQRLFQSQITRVPSQTTPLSSRERPLRGPWPRSGRQYCRWSRSASTTGSLSWEGTRFLSIQVIARAKKAGLRLTLKQIFQHQTIAELALVAEAVTHPYFEQGLITGEVPLTPIQKWFFEQAYADNHHWNQATLLELKQDLDSALLDKAIRQLVLHHDALRLRFQRSDSGWTQFNAGGEEAVKLTLVDLAGTPEEKQISAMETAAAELQGNLNLSHGPVISAALFNFGCRRPSRLLLAIHHLAVDGVSWRILLEDLQVLCEQLRSGGTVRLPDKTLSFRKWAQELAEYARSATLEHEADYWLAVSSAKSSPIPVDFSGAENTEASAHIVSVSLDAEETSALLQKVPQAYNTEINDVLLAALGLALTSWIGQPVARINLEGHGREELSEGIDLSRTVGWFTTMFPVNLDLRATAGPGEVLKSIKEQLRRIPQRGIGYGILRYLRGDESLAAQLRSSPQPEIAFNYLGQFDQTTSASPFVSVEGLIGPVHSPLAQRSHLLSINSLVINGRLRVDWGYSEGVHRRSTIERLAQSFIEALRSLIHHCTSASAGGYTPSDFSEAGLDQQELDSLIAELGEGDLNMSEQKKLTMSEQKKNIDSIYPLSPVQQGMLFHTLLAPKSRVYFNQVLYTLTGCLQKVAMQRAWQQVVDRHEALRTLFVWQAREKPLQVVRRRVTLPWEELDWRGLSADEQNAKLAAFLQADRQRGFDLTQAPLMRLALIRLGENHHELIWSHHHLLIDGWSSFLILKDVMTIYQAISEGRDCRLEPVRPYRDYINWLHGQDPSKAEGFWRAALKGFAAQTPLLGSPGAEGHEVQDYEIAEQLGSTPPSLTAALKSFARQNDLTLSTIVQGAWAILLSRYSGETDVVFGSTVSGRSAELVGIEFMVGLFINSLPVRAQFSPQVTTLAWLKDFQDKLVEVRQYEHSPLVDVQGWSEVRRGHPLFQSLVAFENYPVDASVWGQDGTLQISNMRVVGPTNYPLAIVVVPGKELSIRVSYDSRRFDVAAISRMLGHFNTLLEGIVANPGRRPAELPMLTEAERQQVLYEWNDDEADYPEELCVHQLFEQQVERDPDAVAVVYEDRSLSYGELNARSNRLAHHLTGAGRGARRAGGDLRGAVAGDGGGSAGGAEGGRRLCAAGPVYPADRLAFMMQDCAPALILSHRPARAAAGGGDGGSGAASAGRPGPGGGRRLWTGEAVANPDPAEMGLTSGNLAYVIYTSGSTGTPKGVS